MPFAIAARKTTEVPAGTAVTAAMGAEVWFTVSTYKPAMEKPGGSLAVVLGSATVGSVAALPAIIDGLRSQGYQFVTVSQMLARLHAKLPAPTTVQSAKTVRLRAGTS